MVDMKEKATSICDMQVGKDEKIKLLKDLILDCYNEMEAQDQNMHPEVRHDNAEGYRIAKNKLRELEQN